MQIRYKSIQNLLGWYVTSDFVKSEENYAEKNEKVYLADMGLQTL